MALRLRLAALRELQQRLPAGPSISEKVIHDWAGEHLGSDIGEMSEGSIPNRYALTVLIEAIRTPEGMKEFLARKRSLASTDKGTDIWRRFEDDGSSFEAFFDKMDAEYLAEAEERGLVGK